MATILCQSLQGLSLSRASVANNVEAKLQKSTFFGEKPVSMKASPAVAGELARSKDSLLFSADAFPGGRRIQGRRLPRYDVRSRAGDGVSNMLSPWGAILGTVPQRGSKSPASDVYWLLNELARELPAGTSRGSSWDVEEDKDAWYLRFELPGYSAKDVKVQVEEDNVLSIAAQKSAVSETSEKDDRFQSRRMRGGFSTRLTLPEEVQAENISAEVKNGILVVTLPKVVPEQKRPKVISVNVKEALPDTEGQSRGQITDVGNGASEKNA
eukprot:TRINITY_DN1684_c0_g1_i2.p1 TRINITY_DN1684_c0_g1~~TRINITY_DN1684_c0_g1_i2.p1  ORF type:complete len:269 (-),score=56.36 TRINITY_DN1684_c0_g1_i2:789-1595(-)